MPRGQRLRARRVGVLAGGHEQRAVGGEVQRPAVVVARGTQRVEVGQHEFGGRVDRVAGHREAADAVVQRVGTGVIDVDVAVGREVGVEGHTEQPALTDGAEACGQVERRGGDLSPVLDDEQLAVLLRE